MAMPKGCVRKPLRQRFEEKWEIDSKGCWIWHAFIDKAGYARLQEGGRGGRVLYAHRYSYEQHKKMIPDGLQLDHLCRVRHCVNPEHLEAVTPQMNMARGQSPTMLLHMARRCKRGHEIAGTNAKRAGPQGRYRQCGICQSDRARRYYRASVSSAS